MTCSDKEAWEGIKYSEICRSGLEFAYQSRQHTQREGARYRRGWHAPKCQAALPRANSDSMQQRLGHSVVASPTLGCCG
jgi:hypothetical protein